jgi:hypothetical protein
MYEYLLFEAHYPHIQDAQPFLLFTCRLFEQKNIHLSMIRSHWLIYLSWLEVARKTQ